MTFIRDISLKKVGINNLKETEKKTMMLERKPPQE